MATRSVMWFRRDLRLSDQPALIAAAEDAAEVVPLFVIDPVLWLRSGAVRREYLARSLRALDASMGGRLVVRHGDPVAVLPDVVAEARAGTVHISGDCAPYGAARDRRVEHALSQKGVHLHRTGSPYAVTPGEVKKADGGEYRVFTPFYRAWCERGWRQPAERPEVTWSTDVASESMPDHGSDPDLASLPPAGEGAATRRWLEFIEIGLDSYADNRDRPDLRGTSGLSVHLRFGEIHPRTLLHALGPALERLSKSREIFRRELAWREFCADVMHHQPWTATDYYRPEFARMEYDTGALADDRLHAWQRGMTGYPIVDAGMRQLLAEGWMHNRVRMIVASFLVKDLHLEWQHGARWFMQHLVDGDVASNAHGWQWTAGCGTDAAPYFRVFNPVTQGLRHDPSGDYVRRYVPELSHLDGADAHQPWAAAGGHDGGYPEQIVDHAAERLEALARYQLVKDSGLEPDVVSRSR